MTSDRSTGPLTLLADVAGAPVAPHVAARLDRLLGCDPAALLQTGILLTPAQLAGRTPLPDPLPEVPAVRAAVPVPADAAERHLLLCAAVAVTPRADVLLAAADTDVATLVGPAVGPALELHRGRFRLRDPRVRTFVHETADLADRTRAHAALAVAARAAGEHGAALWHTALSTLAGDELLTDGLLELAGVLLARGDVEAAHAVAREATSHAAGERRVQAFHVAGRAALWSGYLDDAGHWLRRARGSGESGIARSAQADAAALAAVEGDPPEPADVDGSGPGAALARSVEPLARVAATPPDRVVLEAVVAALGCADTDLPRADALLARVAAGLRPALRRPAPWAVEAGAVSPVAEAHLRTVQALLLLVCEEPDRAAAVLDDAAGRLPLTCVVGGLAAEVARQLAHVERGGRSEVRSAMLRLAPPHGMTAVAVTAVLRQAVPSGPSILPAPVADPGGAPPAARPAVWPELATAVARGVVAVRSGPAEGAPSPPSAWSEALTARELEVAGLVATGRANREVAEELCVSVRTVEVHLGRVFRKLGVRTRSELVVLALRPGR